MCLDMIGLSISCLIQVAALSSIVLARLRSCRQDYMLLIPDELLPCIFQKSSLSAADRKSISLVCRKWYKIEGWSRQRLTLYGTKDLIHHLPFLFSRFDSVMHIVVHWTDDDTLLMISKLCGKLQRLEFAQCCSVTDDGMAAFAMNCHGLKELYVEDCKFGVAAFNSLLNNCPLLEHLSVRDLNFDTTGIQLIWGPWVAASSLKSISLSTLRSGVGHYFVLLITSSKQLEKLHLYCCSGDWGIVFSIICTSHNNLKDVRLEMISFSEAGLAGLASCTSLERLHISDVPVLCSNTGIRSIAEGCKNLRKLHIDLKCRFFSIDNDGLLAISQHCANIEELVFVRLKSTPTSLTAIASNCLKLKQMTFRKCNLEIASMADKCPSVKKLLMEGCPISEKGLQSLVSGFPNLQELKLSKCEGMSQNAAVWLKSKRPSLSLSICLGGNRASSLEDLAIAVAYFVIFATSVLGL